MNLQQGSKRGGQLSRQRGELSLSQVVPLVTVLRERRSPSSQQHRQAQGKDVCLGEVAVVLKS